MFFVDDDMLFGPGHVDGLLAHEKPIVSALYFNRKPPYYPVAYNRQAEDEHGLPIWNPVDLTDAPSSGWWTSSPAAPEGC